MGHHKYNKIFKETNNHINSLLKNLEDIKDVICTPKTALAWTHLASILQSSKSVILCINCKQSIPVPVILRTILEGTVNCILLQKNM